MNNQIIPFDFENKTVRMMIIDTQEWWVGRDVAVALGYQNSNEAINTHCRGVAKRYPIVDSLGRTQEARIINEGDVFRLITHSNLPEAQRFEKRLFEEVLPQIRKTGSCGAAQVPSLEAVNKFLEENVPRIKWLVSENARLRQMNRLYEEKERLRQQLARKNTPVSEDEKLRILAYASRWSVAEIARFTGRSESAVRNVIKKGGGTEAFRQTLGYPSFEALIGGSRGKGGTA